MTIAFICVLIAIILPQIWAAVAKSQLVKSKQYDNSASRLQLENLTGPQQRAKWAEQNSYEALPGFIAAVIIAHLAGAEQATMDMLAVVHVVARLAYGVCYIRDLPSLRSLVWVVGFGAMVGLFVAGF
jgi:uncharacterized MAPEG superfamily protein